MKRWRICTKGLLSRTDHEQHRVQRREEEGVGEVVKGREKSPARGQETGLGLTGSNFECGVGREHQSDYPRHRWAFHASETGIFLKPRLA